MTTMTPRNARVAAIATSLAIAGCSTATLPGASRTPAQPAPQSALQTNQAEGVLALKVNWPELPANYAAQAIPDRAASMSLLISDAAGMVLVDRKIDRITSTSYPFGAPYGQSVWDGRQYVYVPSTMSWTFPEQEGLKVKAILFDSANQEVGRAERTADIVAGMTNTVVLDVVAQDAPVLTSVNSSELRIGAGGLVLTGSGFTRYPNVSVFFQTEGYSSGTSTDSFEPNGYKYYLQPSDFRVVSDTRIEATVSTRVLYDRFSSYGYTFEEAFSDYFLPNSAERLYLGVTVDGVPSHRLAVSVPRTGALKAEVSITQGQNAPASSGLRTDALDFRQPPYNVPIASGTVWIYQITDTYGPPRNLTLKLNYPYGLGTSPDCSYLDDQYGDTYTYSINFAGSFPQFAGPKAKGAIQNLGEVPYKWQGQPVMARHLFYTVGNSPSWTDTMELWLLPGIGVARAVETTTYLGLSNRGPDTQPSPYVSSSSSRQWVLTSYQAAPPTTGDQAGGVE